MVRSKLVTESYLQLYESYRLHSRQLGDVLNGSDIALNLRVRVFVALTVLMSAPLT